jgi:sigma-B regulation protein RsbU (phosphoserine phosphatase)
VDSVYKHGKTLITDDAMSDQELLKFPSVVKYGLKSILCVPIRHHEKIIGVCYLDNPLSSHVFSEEDAQLLGVFISQAAIALDNASLYDNLEKKVEQRTQELSLAYEKLNLAYSKMKGEMMLAKKIQNSIMPKNIGKVNELYFHIQYLPLMEVGGDIYDIYALGEEKVRIFLADATGHGVAASLITMLIKSEYEKLKISQESPSKIFENLNRIFYHSYRSLNVFFTGVILDIFIKEKKILYSSAGHPAQFLIENGELVEMAKTGRAVNIYPEINCVDREISFKNKLKLLLYSDGIYEEFAANKEEFGYERLVEAVQHNATRPINYIMNDLIQRVQNFVGRGEYNDDITLVGVE